MLYKQCILRKGNKVDVAWIPAQYAVLNKTLRISNSNGWIVDAVSSRGLDYDKLNLDSRDYVRTRQYSDM